MAKSKGRAAVGYVFMLIGFWIGGEVVGAIAGAVILAFAGVQPEFLTVIPFALAGAGLGAALAFVIVHQLSDLSWRPRQYYAGLGGPGGTLPPYQPSSNPYAPPAAGTGPAPRLVQCPSCRTYVQRPADGMCPACRQRLP
jgi:hypothetical protein